MSFSNPLFNEIMVPRAPLTEARIEGFYQGVGWETWHDSSKNEFIYVSPKLATSNQPAPTLGYWLADNIEDKEDRYVYNITPDPSEFAVGPRLPKLLQVVEICLVVPTADDVHDIYDRGGKLLEAHSHVKPRQHAGVQEFRMNDPFNIAYRVTEDPGWELRKTQPEYNPNYVNYMTGRDGLTVPVITRSILREVAASMKDGDVQLGERAYNAVTRYTSGNIIGYRTEIIPKFDDYFEFDPSGVVIGLKPGDLAGLISRIEDKNPKVVNFGDGCLKLLKHVNDLIVADRPSRASQQP